RRVVGADPLDAGGPVAAAILDLARLSDEVTDLGDAGILAADRLGIGNRERAGAAEPGARAAGRRGARQDDEEVGAKALDLLAYRLVGALTYRDHDDQGGDADKDAEHGER